MQIKGLKDFGVAGPDNPTYQSEKNEHQLGDWFPW
jgi:hypothetical protein